MLKKVGSFLLIAIVITIISKAAIVKEGATVDITWPKNIVEFSSDDIFYKKTGGSVFISNAPETINEDGTLLKDGSLVSGQYNNTLYRDYLTGSFRFWASHYNKTKSPLKFWLVVENVSDKDVNIYRTLSSYSHGPITTAASRATVAFMEAEKKDELLATLKPGVIYYFQYSEEVPIEAAMVYIAEFRAVTIEGADAKVEVSNVVTMKDIEDPREFVVNNKIAMTNATKDQSDDYRGVLEHWGREGKITLRLSNLFTSWGVSIGDRGYIGEQENLISRWNTKGEPIEPAIVRFITPTIDRIRQAYWYIDYQIQIEIENASIYNDFQCYYGSAGYNPGFVNYQINQGLVVNKHFSKDQAVLITKEKSFHFRTMVMPSAYLPFCLYFVTGQSQ